MVSNKKNNIKYDQSKYSLIEYFTWNQKHRKNYSCYSICSDRNSESDFNYYYIFRHDTVLDTNNKKKITHKFIKKLDIISDCKILICEMITNEVRKKTKSLIGKTFIYTENKGYAQPKKHNNKITCRKRPKNIKYIKGFIKNFIPQKIDSANKIREESNINILDRFYMFVDTKNNGNVSKFKYVFNTHLNIEIILENEFGETIDKGAFNEVFFIDDKNIDKYIAIDKTIGNMRKTIEIMHKEIENEKKKQNKLLKRNNYHLYSNQIFI